MIPKIFVIGSCRIWNTAKYKQWLTSKENSIIQAHFSDEIIQILSWLKSKVQLTDNENNCFRYNIPPEKWEKSYRIV